MRFRIITVAISFAINMNAALSSNFVMPNQEDLLAPSRNLYSELLPHYNKMIELTNKNKFAEAIKMDKPFISLFENMISSQMDLEELSFTRFMALYIAYSGLAKQSFAEIQNQNAYYLNAIDSLNQYLKDFGNNESRISRCQYRLLSHRSLIWKLLGDAQSQLSLNFSNANNRNTQKIYTESAIQAYVVALKHIESSRIISGLSKSQLEGCLDLEKRCQFQLLQLHCNLASYENSLCHPNFTEARKLCAIIKKNNNAMYSRALESLQVVEKLIESDRTSRQISGIRHRTTKNLLSKKADGCINKALEIHASGNTDGFEEDLRVKANRIYSGVKSISLDVSEESFEKIREQIRLLETTISNELDLSEETPLIEILGIVYNYLSEVSAENDLKNSFRAYVLGFGKHADIDGAIDRLEIIRQIQVKKLGQVDILNRILLARLKVLRGEPDEWLALEQENMTKANKKNEKKRRQKAKKRLAHASAITASIEQTKEEQDKKAQQLEEQKTNLEAARMREKVSSDKGKEEASDFYDDSAHETYVRRQQEKQEKLERHERALQARAEQERMASAEPAFLEEVVASQPEEEESNIDEDLQISELYHLTGVAAEVESQIVNNTWKITREDLEQYFVAMNCVYKEGKGSHGKLQLPKSMHVEKDGEVVTIFIESGGAMTLPPWDKGYLPDYLKKQVLAAREKLRTLGIKALMECKR